MTTKQQVLAIFDKNPALTSYQIAERLCCNAAYVRATLRRNGRKLAQQGSGRPKRARAAIAKATGGES